MSVNELMSLHEYYRENTNVRNINCGMLRRIGKTRCLHQMIENFAKQCDFERNMICILVPNMNFSIPFQRLANVDIEILTLENGINRSTLSLSRRIYFFADEVPNAETILSEIFAGSNSHYQFVAGFYYNETNQHTRNYEHYLHLEELQIPANNVLISDEEPIKLINTRIEKNVEIKNNKLRFISKDDND